MDTLSLAKKPYTYSRKKQASLISGIYGINGRMKIDLPDLQRRLNTNTLQTSPQNRNRRNTTQLHERTPTADKQLQQSVWL